MHSMLKYILPNSSTFLLGILLVEYSSKHHVHARPQLYGPDPEDVTSNYEKLERNYELPEEQKFLADLGNLLKSVAEKLPHGVRFIEDFKDLTDNFDSWSGAREAASTGSEKAVSVKYPRWEALISSAADFTNTNDKYITLEKKVASRSTRSQDQEELVRLNQRRDAEQHRLFSPSKLKKHSSITSWAIHQCARLTRAQWEIASSITEDDQTRWKDLFAVVFPSQPVHESSSAGPGARSTKSLANVHSKRNEHIFRGLTRDSTHELCFLALKKMFDNQPDVIDFLWELCVGRLHVLTVEFHSPTQLIPAGNANLLRPQSSRTNVPITPKPQSSSFLCWTWILKC